jgi:hypothetical protein
MGDCTGGDLMNACLITKNIHERLPKLQLCERLPQPYTKALLQECLPSDWLFKLGQVLLSFLSLVTQGCCFKISSVSLLIAFKSSLYPSLFECARSLLWHVCSTMGICHSQINGLIFGESFSVCYLGWWEKGRRETRAVYIKTVKMGVSNSGVLLFFQTPHTGSTHTHTHTHTLVSCLLKPSLPASATQCPHTVESPVCGLFSDNSHGMLFSTHSKRHSILLGFPPLGVKAEVLTVISEVLCGPGCTSSLTCCTWTTLACACSLLLPVSCRL